MTVQEGRDWLDALCKKGMGSFDLGAMINVREEARDEFVSKDSKTVVLTVNDALETSTYSPKFNYGLNE